jgi:hypothetical protein
MRLAAGHFLDQASDMTELHVDGIRYQNSGYQAAFGGYLEGLITAELVKAFADNQVGRKLIVRPSRMPAAKLRGIELAKRPSLRPEQFDDRPGVYVLSGSYWEALPAMDVRLSLRDARDRSLAWRGLVHGDSLPSGVALRPAMPTRPGGDDRQGPIGLGLSSDRGPNPIYRVGDNLNLLIDLHREAWLYCFYRQGDGRMLRIIPNAYYPVAHLPGGQVHKVPGRIAEFDLHFTPPPGYEMVKCFATSRDVAADLPPELQSQRWLPAGWDWRLAHEFRQLSGAMVSEASLMITLNK